MAETTSAYLVVPLEYPLYSGDVWIALNLETHLSDWGGIALIFVNSAFIP